MRNTHQSREVLRAMMTRPKGRHYGYELSKAAGIKSGVIYPILRRMTQEGWVKQELGGKTDAYPPRLYYKLTGLGRSVASERLGDLDGD